MFERGEVRFRELFNDAQMTFESNIPYTLRFMIDQKASHRGRVAEQCSLCVRYRSQA